MFPFFLVKKQKLVYYIKENEKGEKIMADYIYLYWLILFVVLILFEIATLGLTTIWFAGGALIAFILSLFQVDLWIQIVVFVVVSVVLLFFTRPYAQKHFNKNLKKTNVEEIIGKQGKVLEDIDNKNSQGKVSLNGMVWTARSETEDVICKESFVQVVRVEGVKLIVKELREEEK